ncbi:MAG: ABC transporter substrate-binding protein [Archaeoglobus sp.]|nr:ABC transporter substrate-binding protein [Archaeoglobus sp.]
MNKIYLTVFLSILLLGCSQPEGIYVVKLSPPDMIEQFKLKQIDGFVAWEPFVTKGEEFGKVMLKSSDIWKHHPCCVVAHSASFKDDDALKAVVWAHVKATEFIKDEKNKEKVIEYASEFTGLEKNVVAKALENIEYTTYPNEKEFRFYFEKLKEYGLLTKKLSDLGYKSEDDFFSDFLRKDIIEAVKKSEPPKYDGKVRIRIGYLTADLHQLALYVAVKEGYLDATSLKYELKQYKNGVAVMEAFRAGEIDVAYLGGAPATLKRVNDDIGIRIIAGANNEGSALVVQNNIESFKDLKGKTVAIPGYGTVQDFLLRIAAEKYGMKVISK